MEERLGLDAPESDRRPDSGEQEKPEDHATREPDSHDTTHRERERKSHKKERKKEHKKKEGSATAAAIIPTTVRRGGTTGSLLGHGLPGVHETHATAQTKSLLMIPGVRETGNPARKGSAVAVAGGVTGKKERGAGRVIRGVDTT
eukprot:CAMPEP_0185764726 /NCGR_PEP_ID=MMETSP1174-20130828/23695_1 /TAXON_ID=35687 /ORGANISM="Dictyocha speculum, Strain CCMP1381" /LENGTH=144 /DNA_ID=CAMNT_0028447393 /DNA_START=94 /DNA_END=525 /DNA_ORIENTATION=+